MATITIVCLSLVPDKKKVNNSRSFPNKRIFLTFLWPVCVCVLSLHYASLCCCIWGNNMTMDLSNSGHSRSSNRRGSDAALFTGSTLQLSPTILSQSTTNHLSKVTASGIGIDDAKQHHSNVTVKWSSVRAGTPLWMTLLMLMGAWAGRVSCDYENTWNFYNEPPCCITGDSQRHIKYKRGK